MLSIEPTGKILGAKIRGVDLSKPLSGPDLGQILLALSQNGIIGFPGQSLSPKEHIAFATQLGEIHESAEYHDPEDSGLSILSNIKENGENVGYVDAGMIWHKDMTYVPVPGFTTVLHALKVPRRDGKALGGTQFINARAAYDDLPDELKRKLEGKTCIHSVKKYNAVVRGAGSKRDTYDKLPRKNPPMSHPHFLTHPVSGQIALYCDPSHAERINELPAEESDEILAFLEEHQLQPKYQFVYEWDEGDVLMWDNLSTLHRSTIDYGPDEIRLIKRCQVMSDKVFDPAFVKSAMDQATAA